MCEKDKKIAELEQKLATVIEESHEREAKLFETLASGRNHESQTFWRPWQVALIPIVIAILGGLASIAIALAK